MTRIATLIMLSLLFATTAFSAPPQPLPQLVVEERLTTLLQPTLAAHPDKSGIYVLEKGEEALLARAWLADHAGKSIDIQYFIWSSDNIGILASEALLRAAERGVKVRVLVDDLLIEAPPEAMLALALHPNVEIRIYNPLHKVGTSQLKRATNLVTNFRAANQRMHDKTAIFDNLVAITGGRNMADEYFDFDHDYNFRDRDLLALGPVAGEMTASFERFWSSPLAQPVEDLLPTQLKKLTPERVAAVYAGLHGYAQKSENFAPEVRQALVDLPGKFAGLLRELVWDEARFLCDLPGKNDGQEGLAGGGQTTTALVAAVKQAQKRVTIQSPYLGPPGRRAGTPPGFGQAGGRGADRHQFPRRHRQPPGLQRLQQAAPGDPSGRNQGLRIQA